MRRHLYYYTHVAGPSDELIRRLGDEPGLWLPLPAEPVPEGRWHIRISADGALPAPIALRDALVTVGPPEDVAGGGVVRSVLWRATSADWLFPTILGELELGHLDGGGAQLTISGTYRPPLSVLGSGGVDRPISHRAAEACVRRFVLDVAGRLEPSTLPL